MRNRAVVLVIMVLASMALVPTQTWAATATQALTITVAPAPLPLKITTTSLPSGTAGSIYPNTQLLATGGMGGNIWSIAPLKPGETGLPTGLSLSTSGVLSGTLASSDCTGTTACVFSFTVQVVDAGGSAQMIKVNGVIEARAVPMTSIVKGRHLLK